MATLNNAHVPDEVLAVDELAEEALRKGPEDRDWQELLAYGRQTDHESGYTAAEVSEIVKKRRRISAAQRG
ncbi:MAG: hypothetical protein ABSG65_22485 [Bryobacteraceae bacterium]